MQRYFTLDKLNTEETFKVINEDTHHMINVMRFRVDDTFEMVDRDKIVFFVMLLKLKNRL